jgi:hypothetical protein
MEFLDDIAPKVDSALEKFLDFLQIQGDSSGFIPILNKIFEFFGELFAKLGFSFV